jgi:hypothetical protein
LTSTERAITALTGIAYRLSLSASLSVRLQAARFGRVLRDLMGLVMETSSEKHRTLQQNKALHKYLAELSEALNDAGLDMKAVLKPNISIPWTPEMTKEHIWKPVQNIMLDKDSTTELSTTDIDAIYQVISRHLAEKFGVAVAFPDRYSQAEDQLHGK